MAWFHLKSGLGNNSAGFLDRAGIRAPQEIFLSLHLGAEYSEDQMKPLFALQRSSRSVPSSYFNTSGTPLPDYSTEPLERFQR